MRKFFLLLVILFSLCSTVLKAQENSMYYVHFVDDRVWGYPKEFVKDLSNDGGMYVITLMNDSIVSWSVDEVISVNEQAPVYPQFTAFKLDDKLNDQLFRDVEAVVTTDEVRASVSGIGKYLTPSFTMDMPNAVAYACGKEQVSGKSRLRFAEDVVYTLSLPGHERLSVEKVSDEIWSYPESGKVEIPLTVDMLSTNAPTSIEGEGLGMMLDNNPSTIFHSTWSRDPVYDVDLSKQVYVSVELPYAISDFQFYYMGRTGTSTYNVYEWVIEASNDGEGWTGVALFDESDGLPISDNGGIFTSPTISLGASYRYLRFTASRVGYKNYLCLSEFRLYEVLTNEDEGPVLIQPAQYAYQMVPMGRKVSVHIDWLTDNASSVPRIDINIDGGEMVSSKDYYLDADISFQGNGVWDDYDFEGRVKIKGRGNSSWSTPSSYYNPKNPYRLKFEESVKPFGMKKGKNWNLIAQKQTGSLMTNPVAHKIARMVGMQTANDVIPVELYMNGEYRGSYYFTQKVGMANNSVDFDDESMAALFELDSYSEAGKFYSNSFSLPVNIKSPEFGEDETLLDYGGVKDEFNRFETAVYNNSNYERFVDMDMLVGYMLVNDLVLNTELGHPKSSFLSREDMGKMTRRYVFGPAWDFDWAYGYEGTGSYCVSGEARDLFSYVNGSGASFYSKILRSSDWVQYRYYKLWEDFIDKHLDELIDFVDDYYAYAQSSFVHNASKWGDGSNYDTNVANMKSWLEQRALNIKKSLKPYGAGDLEPFTYGDVNGDGAVDGADMELMLSVLLGTEEESLLDERSYKQMDADADESISLSDLTWINLLAEDEAAALSRGRREHPLWSDRDEEAEDVYDFDIEDMRTLTPVQGDAANSVPMRTASAAGELGLVVSESEGKWNVEVSLVSSTPYIAYAMDFVIPEAFTLPDGDANMTLSYRTEGSFVMEGRWVNEGVYRVIGYSRDNSAMTDAEGPLFTLALGATPSLSVGDYDLSVENACAVTENAMEDFLDGASVAFAVDEEQLSNIETSEYTPYWPADVYDVHGRLVRKAATSLEGLSRGVYLVNNRKVVR